MFSKQQLDDLNYLNIEAAKLEAKPTLNSQEERRHSRLLSQISLVKNGASLDEITRQDFREREKAAGLRPAYLETDGFTPEQRATHKAWLQFAKGETRAMSEGNLAEQIGTYNELGYFVPVGFRYELVQAMKNYEPLFDSDVVTFIETPNAEPIAMPQMNDTGNVATLLSEASAISEVDLSNVSHTSVGAYKFTSGLYSLSREAFEDIAVGLNEINNFKRISALRFARGVGAYLLNGTGDSQPTGLLTALAASGITPVTAAGASANDGGSETGTNSIGTQDLANAYFAVDPLYRKSSKCAWLMADSTLQSLCRQLDKMGRPIIEIVRGVPTLYGKRVLSSPNMPSIAASATTVVFGDLSFFVVRHATSDTFIKLFQEAPGLVENGLMSWMAIDRYDSNLISFGANEAPLTYIQQHS
jgi:HK97 family phage major capsid protein